MGSRSLAVVLVGVALLAAVAVGGFAVVQLWPDDDGSTSTATTDDTTTETTAADREPQVSDKSTTTSTPGPLADDLLGGDFPAAYQDLLAAAGQPAQLLEMSIYDGYAFLAYRDPADPGVVDRREWRAGEVGDAAPNPATDRVDAAVEPDLFAPTDVDPTIVAQLVADAPLQYDIPVTVSHVIIDRFLPFDDRVLIRVYAVPTDGRSGGGYVSYDTAGALVNVCC